MSAGLQVNQPAPAGPTRVVPRRIAAGRAVLALGWAAAVVIAVGDRVPTTDTELPTAAAFVLASYPLIDVIASLCGAAFGDARALRTNAAISALATVGIAIAAFGADAGATLVAFGTWAVVSGGIQLGLAIRRRRMHGRELPMIVSGGLSTLAGLSFIRAASQDTAHLATLGGYMAMGALLFLLWARRGDVAPRGEARRSAASLPALRARHLSGSEARRSSSTAADASNR